MSILSYFKPKDGLPDPNGSLSSILPSQAIALANKEVEKVISEKGDTKKHGATATEYRSVALWGSLSQSKTSPRTGFHLLLYTW